MIALSRRYRFAAAHALRREDRDEPWNERVYGKCANPAGHGHDYGLEITVTGEVDPTSGQLVSRERLDALVTERVLERFGHSRLNDDPAFAERVPTAENIAQAIRELLAPAIAAEGAHLARVRLEETRKNSFEIGDPR